ncbi:MAG TPA: hypothetical protein VG276_20320 [Actinomycetes bacterium]|jgi:hypothetical protein|nr:hypothetical protein [Actinomycetes bacterium]
MEFDRVYEEFVPGPDAQGEADLHELGRRVAEHLHYQATNEDL